MNISQQLEAVLFWKAEPLSIKKLSTLLNTDENTIKDGLKTLEQNLEGRGIVLVQTDNEIMLGTAKEASSLIEQLTKEDLARDLGKAGLETLSIILYQGPISRADIDYIRGVNSQFIIRNLLIRGLIERTENTDSRGFLYKSSLDLLSHLGLTKITDLPEYDKVRSEINSFRQSPETTETSDTPADATI